MKVLLLLALLVPGLSHAVEGPPPSDPFPRFGLSAAAGLPDGAVLSGLYRPLDWLRLSAGGSWNYFGWGLQGGAGVAPLHWPIDPTFNLEYGHYFDSDLSRFTSASAGVPAELQPLLRHVGYDYVSAQVGVEIGSSRRMAFFARAGLSLLWTTIHGTAETQRTSGGQNITVRITDPSVRATFPSLKLGVLYYF